MPTQEDSNQQASIEVCFGPECSDHGSRELATELERLGLDIIIGDCRSQCPHAPLILINNRMICKANADKVQARIKDISEHPEKYTY